MTIPWSRGGVDLHLESAAGGQRNGLENALRAAIQARRLAAGTLLPSSRVLAADLGVSRGTVVAAYDQLVAEGYLLTRPRAGTVVADLGPVNEPQPEQRGIGARRMDLRPGTPDVTSFPMAAWLRATRRAMADASTSALGYGDIRGRIELRAALVEYLGRTRGVQARPEQVMITAGATHALHLLSTTLAAAGRAALATEDPGFSLHRPLVRRAGQRVVGLAVDDRGVRVDRLPEITTDDLAGVLVTPAHQYPTGVTMHPSRRHALTAWARAEDRLIVEDDYDGEFRYDRQPIGALQGTAPDHVVYVGTASKTLAPGVRLGWMVLPDRLIEPLIDTKKHVDLAAPVIAQLTLAELITSHEYDRHVRTMRLRYRRRRDLLVETLDRVEPGLVTGVAAGLQALVRLPVGGPSEEAVIAAAAAEGLVLEGLGPHRHDADRRADPALVIGFSKPSERAYPATIALLARVLRRTLNRAERPTRAG
jgi:GntR family transcriptional regulator / MocR family aminotransferase